MWWSTMTGRLEQAAALDPAAAALEKAVGVVLPPGAVKDALHGTWLGHAVHPLLVALPIGMWSGASVLDLTGGDRNAARRLVAAGILAALPASATGLADWSEVGSFQRAKRVGLAHSAANTVTVALYAASWLARWRGDQARGRALALAGLVGMSVSGYLGGHLAYSEGVGVNRNADEPVAPTSWTDAAASSDVDEGAVQRVEVDGQSIVLTRQAGTVHGMGATCSHYGAPLEDAEVSLDGAEPCLVCPWHGSRFRLRDGAVARGPATSPQRSYDVREQGGRLQVRVRS